MTMHKTPWLQISDIDKDMLTPVAIANDGPQLPQENGYPPRKDALFFCKGVIEGCFGKIELGDMVCLNFTPCEPEGPGVFVHLRRTTHPYPCGFSYGMWREAHNSVGPRRKDMNGYIMLTAQLWIKTWWSQDVGTFITCRVEMERKESVEPQKESQNE